MPVIYKLYNQIKHYEWGSHESIPHFLGFENSEDLPCAEMWMGTHSGAPSQVQPDGNNKNRVNLADISGDLPFLFKLLAADKPLSIQAHPNLLQASEGFRRENEAAISLNDPVRNYKDPNHKPEIICAITPFLLMAGFREPSQIRKSLECLASEPLLKETFLSLLRALDSSSLKGFFNVLFNLTETERKNIGLFFSGDGTDKESGVISPEQFKLMKNFAAVYPDDAAVISPLYLNLLTLESGQAIFVPAGVLHAYIKGFGVELMSSSDNVLRGGLTNKHIDIPELMNILNFVPYMPQVYSPPLTSSFFCYPAPCADFLLFFIRGNGGDITFNGNCPAVCIVTEGELHTSSCIFKKGESIFINRKEGDPCPVFSGSFSLYAACSVI